MLKRAALALATMGMAAVTCMPASAATQTGAVQMKWNVSATAAMTLATNYSGTGAQGTGANALQPSIAGTCTNAAAETAFTMTFGALTPSATAEVACNYQKAVAATVTTNDSLGYKVEEWLASTATAGVQFCAFPNNAGAATTAAPSSSQATAPAAIAAGACATGGTILPAGTLVSAGTAGNPGTAGLITSTAPGTPYTWASTAAVAAGLVYGQDIQLNLAPNQGSSAADTSYIIVSLIPN